MDLAVYPGALLVNELEGMATVSMHMAPAIRDTAVAKCIHYLVNGFGVLAEIFPKHGRVITAAKMGCRMPLLSMNQMRKLCRISDEENWCVVLHKIPVAFISAKLDREASGVSSVIMRTAFATNGRKSNCDGALFSFNRENVCKAKVIERFGSSIVAMGTTALCMDYSLRDSLTIKM